MLIIRCFLLLDKKCSARPPSRVFNQTACFSHPCIHRPRARISQQFSLRPVTFDQGTGSYGSFVGEQYYASTHMDRVGCGGNKSFIFTRIDRKQEFGLRVRHFCFMVRFNSTIICPRWSTSEYPMNLTLFFFHLSVLQTAVVLGTIL